MRLPINVQVTSIPSRLIRAACREPGGRFRLCELIEAQGDPEDRAQCWKTGAAAFAAHRPALLRRLDRGVYEVTNEGRLYVAALERREAAGKG